MGRKFIYNLTKNIAIMEITTFVAYLALKYSLEQLPSTPC